MTKDEIKALVAAKIAGQGSAIDAASVLPTILDAIVDAIPEGGGGNEALIIEGTVDGELNFTPNEGQPTIEEAKAAISQGRDVIITEDKSYYYHWIYVTLDEGIIYFSTNAVGDYINWASI